MADLFGRTDARLPHPRKRMTPAQRAMATKPNLAQIGRVMDAMVGRGPDTCMLCEGSGAIQAEVGGAEACPWCNGSGRWHQRDARTAP